jgi:hypothetical protein
MSWPIERFDFPQIFAKIEARSASKVLSFNPCLRCGLQFGATFFNAERYAAPRRRAFVGSRTMPTSESGSCWAASWPSRRIIPPMNAQIKQKHTPSAVGIRANGMEISSQSRVARRRMRASL